MQSEHKTGISIDFSVLTENFNFKGGVKYKQFKYKETLIEEYRKYLITYKQFYEEQKREKKQNDRVHVTPQNNETSENIDNTINELSKDDPWMQRKNQESNENVESSDSSENPSDVKVI